MLLRGFDLVETGIILCVLKEMQKWHGFSVLNLQTKKFTDSNAEKNNCVKMTQSRVSNGMSVTVTRVVCRVDLIKYSFSSVSIRSLGFFVMY